jgi:hypothetical protein
MLIDDGVRKVHPTLDDDVLQFPKQGVSNSNQQFLEIPSSAPISPGG